MLNSNEGTSKPLCRTCRHMQSSNVCSTQYNFSKTVKRNQMNHCSKFFIEIEREATECSDYDDKRNPELRIMEKMAFILEKKNVVGFNNPVVEFVKPLKW